MATNRSRDRHGSIFDGAEWDELWRAVVSPDAARPGAFGLGAFRLVMETALVVGTVASSRTRSGMD
jgi:hypothetical protein